MEEAGGIQKDETFVGAQSTDVRESGHETDVVSELLKADQRLSGMDLLFRQISLPGSFCQIENLSHTVVLCRFYR